MQTSKKREAFSVTREPWQQNVGTVQTATQKRELNEICTAFSEATGRGGYVPTLQVESIRCLSTTQAFGTEL